MIGSLPFLNKENSADEAATFVPDRLSRPGSCNGRPEICRPQRIARILVNNKTRQGYARKRILKPAGYFFVAPYVKGLLQVGGVSWQG